MDDQPGTPPPPAPHLVVPSSSGGGSAADPRDRPTRAVSKGVNVTFWWSLRLIVIGIAAAGVLWLLGKGWSLLLPLLLAILLSAVLWPLNVLLRRVKLPRALAAILSLLLLLGAVGGVLALLIPNVAGQAQEISQSAAAGLTQVQDFVTGPPLNLSDTQINSLVDEGVSRLQSNAQNIAGGVVAGATSIGSGVVTFLLVLVLSFFVLADGDRLLPWSRRWLDVRSHHHAVELGGRVWVAVRGYIVSQAVVALVDAIFIGVGLHFIGVQLALPLAVLIFFAAFIPIVGAVSSGAVAVLIALVTLGWPQALLVLGLILVVQQIEGNVLQPFLVGRSLALHPAVVIGSVTVGGTVFGITGAFLAVPVAAIVTVVLRYVHHELVPGEPENPKAKESAKERRVLARRAKEVADRVTPGDDGTGEADAPREGADAAPRTAGSEER